MWNLQEKKNAFDRSLTSMKVDNYEKLKQLVLVEEFKRGVSAEMLVHPDEHKVTDLKSAAMLADDNALTHKKCGFSHKPYPVKSHWSGHSGGKPQGKPSNDDKGLSQKVVTNKPTMLKLIKGILSSGKTNVLSLQEIWSFY